MLRIIKKAGFDTVELLLAGWILKNPQLARIMAEDAELEVRFHVAWTKLTSSEQTLFWKFVWQVLTLKGWLPEASSTFDQMVPPEIRSDVVVYADNILDGLKSNHVVQTMSVLSGNDFRLSRSAAEQCLMDSPQRMVFDTYHNLHYRQDGDEILRTCDSDVLLGLLVSDFNRWRTRIDEIHIQDWSAVAGRSVHPGKGKLPLRQFLRHAINQGWEGILTPERKTIWFNCEDETKRLYDDTVSLATN
jgi:hypothetical protein